MTLEHEDTRKLLLQWPQSSDQCDYTSYRNKVHLPSPTFSSSPVRTILGMKMSSVRSVHQGKWS